MIAKDHIYTNYFTAPAFIWTDKAALHRSSCAQGFYLWLSSFTRISILPSYGRRRCNMLGWSLFGRRWLWYTEKRNDPGWNRTGLSVLLCGSSNSADVLSVSYLSFRDRKRPQKPQLPQFGHPFPFDKALPSAHILAVWQYAYGMFSSDRVRYLPLPGRKDEFYLIRMHPDLYAKLASLVGPKRENIYYDVYCTFANKKR